MLTNCKNRSYPTPDQLNEYYVINGQKKELSNTVSAIDLEIVDSMLIFMCYGDQYKFHVYNKNTFQLIGKFGLEGRGPSEYVMPIILSQKLKIRDSSYLVIFDNVLRSISYVNLLLELNNKRYYPKTINSRNRMISQLSIIKSGVISNNNLFIGSSGDGRNIEGSLFCYDINNDRLSWEPFYNTAKIPVYELNKHYLYASYLASRPDYRNIAAAGLCTEKIDILDSTGKLIRSVVFENEDKQDLSDSYSSPPKGSHQYFTSISVSQDFIYALNIDLIIGDKNVQDTATLVKLSWDEDKLPPVIYKLIPQVLKIEVDEESNRIIGLKPFGSFIYTYHMGKN
jgi:hypothetical protein